jgi:hypothetical protein
MLTLIEGLCYWRGYSYERFDRSNAAGEADDDGDGEGEEEEDEEEGEEEEGEAEAEAEEGEEEEPRLPPLLLSPIP